MAIAAPPEPPGATSWQAHEAERLAHRYGRVRVSMRGPILVVRVFGALNHPWMTVDLAPDGSRTDVVEHAGDPRLTGLKRSALNVYTTLVEARQRRNVDDQWLSREVVAHEAGLATNHTSAALRELVEHGLVERKEEPRVAWRAIDTL